MIREMHSEDMNRVEEIWLEDSIRLHNFVPDAQNFWPRRLPDFRKDATQTGTTYVCEAAGAVNGFLTISRSRPYISSLYVDFHLRGQGIGSSLLDKAKTLADCLDLHVYQKDVHATCFYLRQGFVIVDPCHPEKETGQFKYGMKWSRE